MLDGSELVLADRSLGARSLAPCKGAGSHRFFPSSKLCPCCGHKKEQLSLSMRIYDCENCDWIADRDYSASLNLLGLVRPDGAVRPCARSTRKGTRTKTMPVETKTPKSVGEAGTEVSLTKMND